MGASSGRFKAIAPLSGARQTAFAPEPIKTDREAAEAIFSLQMKWPR